MGMRYLRLQARGGAVVHRNLCSKILVEVGWFCVVKGAGGQLGILRSEDGSRSLEMEISRSLHFCGSFPCLTNMWVRGALRSAQNGV